MSFIGVVMVDMANVELLLAAVHDPKTFLKKQGLFVVLGIVVMVVLARVRLPPPRTA